jgi:putative ABC transport system permease protein
MTSLWKDVAFSVRHLMKRPGETAFAVAAMALGLGASVAIFTVVHALLLRPMPYPDAERLVRVWNVFAKASPEVINVSAQEFQDYRARSRSFETLGAVQGTNFFLCAEKNTERVRGAFVSTAALDVLGVQPVMGRRFVPADELGTETPSMISYGFWQRRLGGDPNVLGRKLLLDCAVTTIVGVMPKKFDFPSGAEIWRPLVLTAPEFAMQGRGWRSLGLIGKLKKDVPLVQAQAELSTIAAQLAAQYPASYPGSLGYDISVISLLEQTVGSMRPMLAVLMSAVGLLLLIACVNVGNLHLTQLADRAGEMAIRVALGASRGRLIRQLVVQQVLVCLAGGLIGLLLADSGVRLLLAYSVEDSIPRVGEIRVDAWVVLFALALSVAVGAALGLLPALHGSGPTFGTTVRDNSRGNSAGGTRTRLRNGLVAAEIGLALMLLVTSVLLARSLVSLLKLQPGFRLDRTVTAQLSLVPTVQVTEPYQKAMFYARVIDAARTLPAVGSVAGVSSLPLVGNSTDWTITIDGRPTAPGTRAPSAHRTTASPGYFQTMGIPLLKGRDLAESDTADTVQVAVINNRMAQTYWPGLDPLGRQFKLGNAQSKRPWIRVVGVVGDVSQRGIDVPAKPEMFVPIAQNPPAALNLVLQTATEADQLAAAIRDSVTRIDPYQAVFNVRTMSDHLGQTLAQRRFSMVLLGVFAAVALTLCLVGVYSVVSSWVTQRTRELGVRIALGAGRAHVLLLVLRHCALITAAGTAFGLVGVIVSSRLLAGLLFGVTPRDPVALLGGALGLFAVAMIACCVPAWRAMRLDPLVCLKSEQGGTR